MALGGFVAGRYASTYNAVDTGITDQGINIQHESRWKEINQSDAYGDSIIDGIYRGGNCYMIYESKEFIAGAITPFWPWGSLGVMMTTGTGAAPIGRLASAVAAAAVLTAQTGSAYNTAGATAIATLTASSAILAPNSPAAILFNSDLRQVPIRQLLLPYTSTSGGTTTYKWYATA